MAFADRDYFKSAAPAGSAARPMRDPLANPGRLAWRPPRTIAGLSLHSVTLWLIVINIAVYVIDLILRRMGLAVYLIIPSRGPFERVGVEVFAPLAGWGHFSQVLAIQKLQLWRFITFQFLHENAAHLGFNMLALFFFGPLVENYLGPRRFLPFYLLSGIGGALMYLILLMIGWRIGQPWVPLIGASAGIFAVLIAAAEIAPNARVLIYFLFPMRLRTLALLFIAFAAYTVLFHGANAGGQAAHLGGAAAGYFLLRHMNLLDLIAWLGKRPPPF
jgi:membrane associated rhomboid family serine protease